MLGYSEDKENQLSLLSSKTSASGKGGYTPTIFPGQVSLTLFICSCVWTTSFLWRVLPSLISWCERINKFSLTSFHCSQLYNYTADDKRTVFIRHDSESSQKQTRPLYARNFSIFLTSFPCRPLQITYFCNMSIFSLTSALVQKLAC